MRARFGALGLLLAWHAAGATILSHSRHHNIVAIELDAGRAEVEWLTPSAFRFRRSFEGMLPPLTRTERAGVPFELEDTAQALVFRTKFVRLSVRKNGARLAVFKSDGAWLAEDVSEPASAGDTITWERLLRPGARWYGLGPRDDAELNAGGRRIEAAVPFLISTGGYGEYYPAPGAYVFDLTRRNRVEVQGRVLDYCFYYGPTPKETLEEHRNAGMTVREPAAVTAAASWDGLRDAVRRLAHASLSGVLSAGFDAAPYRSAEPELRKRAMQLAEAVNRGARPEMLPFFETYELEKRDRGLPIVRAMPLQFPADAIAASHSDQLMVGDELLVAPICSPRGGRDVYLPMGVWTRLENNAVFSGRQTVHVVSGEMPVFARNGTILPLARQVMELHYFPKLGAEFFLFEREAGDYTQVHAAPAADIMRLEIESKVDRQYEWIIHHVDAAREVGFAEGKLVRVRDRGQLRDGTWFHDAQRGNLHVRTRAAVAQDLIINLSF